MYFKILAFINLFDFGYVIIFENDYFYREYNSDGDTFEKFAFAFAFGMPAFILLNLQTVIECFINWDRVYRKDSMIEMSNTATRTNTHSFNLSAALK